MKKRTVEVIANTRNVEPFWAMESALTTDLWSVTTVNSVEELVDQVLEATGTPTVAFVDADLYSVYDLVPVLVRLLTVHEGLHFVILTKRRDGWDIIWSRIHHHGRMVVLQEEPGSVLIEQLVRLSLKEELVSSENRLKERSDTGRLEAIGHLAAGIAHELGTPIQYAMDSAYFFGSAWDCVSENIFDTNNASHPELVYYSEEMPAALDRLNEGLRRVSELLASMRDLAPRPSEEEFEVVDLNAVVRRTLRIAEGTVRQRASLKIDLGECSPLLCRPAKISGALLNLIINAVHAIEESGRHDGEVIVSTFSNGPWVGVEVRDNGCGIPEENRAKVFDLFFTTRKAGEGTGQGLALVQSIIKSHGGRIVFQSETEPGRTGSVFRVLLPSRYHLKEVS